MPDPTVASAGTGDSGLFLGLISGTSVDGIDAALVRFSPAPELIAARTYPLDDSLVEQVLRLSQARSDVLLDDVGRLDTALGEALASAATRLLSDGGVAAADVTAIGSHGQTLRHQPEGAFPFTMQLGDASVIAERCGITTVADFRRRDVAAGGHGAPLVPAFHAATLSDPRENRAILNIGGIANLTLLPAVGTVRGFDTGPGNGLMDAWILRHQGQRYDPGGSLAAQGRADQGLLQSLLADPWLSLPPPKSTGRDQFHIEWLDARLAGSALSPADVQATLNLFTARTIADALRSNQADCTRVLVCGGGVHNPVLLRNLAEQLPGVSVESTAAHGLDPDFVEAMAFAWLARETLGGRPGNLPAVTGARGLRVLGCIHHAGN
ncbi:MAG: anhydro-N-acetylmuramic acid kinase [Gammaproteobacteria bacterium RIFCSPHIGHO2_12_FULL_63_22]|nr:MAG: anhydro-N-acetylmuramic acid kinase [Gammaproteobacteria bacterium RIFCSPHIGHO2_12_FULL_63_22]